MRCHLGAAAVALLLFPAAVRAGCAGDAAGSRLAAIPAPTRVAFLRQRLEAARGPAETWTATWGFVDGALAIGQLAALPFASTRDGRIVLAAGAASAALGDAQMILLPITPPPAPPAGGDVCAELALLEAALERGARNQAVGTGLAAHASNLFLNAALGVLAALAGSQWRTGALTAGVGFALGEVQILTQPTGLVGELARYRAGDLSPAEPGAASARVRVLPRGGAVVSLVVSF
ncbi:hypothetical protein AMOR_12100 [Anaeromyxobacter oryzae]|uniref:Lipoprotein n=1 Tax=Anaeromyxobacter oryzae TaxID=2918170 RepID=A0ABN6MME1_9BACT|nr:hypothetical protein AMOR_12100 [Anaeromyxobacter oryzae]